MHLHSGRFIKTVRRTRGRLDERGLTLVELLITALILAILALVALPGFLHFQTRAKISASKQNQRVLSDAIELYHIDHSAYPQPLATGSDPFGIVAIVALKSLTTPVAYVNPSAFYDPFGLLQLQTPQNPGNLIQGATDSFRPPTPGFNASQSLLYFYYPSISELIDEDDLDVHAYAVVSVGPDRKDSFILYYPFPDSLPAQAGFFGITSNLDTVYDPTNGTISGGDLAAFGGEIAAPRLIGGGD